MMVEENQKKMAEEKQKMVEDKENIKRLFVEILNSNSDQFLDSEFYLLKEKQEKNFYQKLGEKLCDTNWNDGYPYFNPKSKSKSDDLKVVEVDGKINPFFLIFNSDKLTEIWEKIAICVIMLTKMEITFSFNNKQKSNDILENRIFIKEAEIFNELANIKNCQFIDKL